MKAMILAAGLGTRLRPLTDDRPKALVEIDGRTLLEITLSRLRNFGIRDVIINVHHFAGQVVEYLRKNDNFDMHIDKTDAFGRWCKTLLRPHLVVFYGSIIAVDVVGIFVIKGK